MRKARSSPAASLPRQPAARIGEIAGALGGRAIEDLAWRYSEMVVVVRDQDVGEQRRPRYAAALLSVFDRLAS